MLGKMTPTRARGFTLIELMIVLVILGVALAIAIPSFTSWMRKTRVNGTANEYAQMLNFVRSEALKRNRPIYFRASRTGPENWQFRVTTTDSSSTCAALDANCDLRSMSSTDHSSITLQSDLPDGLNDMQINPRSLLPVFSDSSTATKSVVFENGEYQIQVDYSVTGVIRLCIPAGHPLMGGHKPC